VLVDYHTHHYRCGHAEGNLEDYVEAAIAAGLEEIGLSDHSPIYHFGDDPHHFPRTAMSQHELASYMQEIEHVRARYRGRIVVRLGIESDYVMGWDQHYRALWARFPLDYVIGSVHWLEQWSIFNPERPPERDQEHVYEEYLLTTQAAARSGAYDIIGHLDCIKTVGHLPERGITPLLEQTVRVIAESDVAIELNTSGWRKPIAEPYPRQELLALCRHYHVPVTLSSDAHAPSQVGYGFDRAVSLLREVGYREVAVFEARKRQMLPLV
jgi:histidinol-phosphatase (PHP family)